MTTVKTVSTTPSTAAFSLMWASGFVGITFLFLGGWSPIPLLVGAVLCVISITMMWIQRTAMGNSDLEIEFDSNVTMTHTGFHSPVVVPPTQEHTAESESLKTEIAYREKLAELESYLRNAVPAREPDVDPQIVIDRLTDLNVDTTTSVDASGAVTIVLRKHREETQLPAVVG